MDIQVYLETGTFPPYERIDPGNKEIMLLSSKEHDLFIFNNKVYEVSHIFDCPKEIEEATYIYLKPITFEKKEIKSFLNKKTDRTKRLLSNFNHSDISILFKEEKGRKPARDSKLAGLDQQEGGLYVYH